MKPFISICFIIIFTMFSALCNAQNVIITREGIKYNATSVYLAYNIVVFIDAKTKKEIVDVKKAFKSVLFNNGLHITYTDFRVQSQTGYNYNSTVNLINGDFFTAQIIHITADSISYLSPAGKDTLFISPLEVIEINYINGVSEHFASNDSLFKKAEAAKPITAKPHYKKSSVLYVGAGAGYINSWTYINHNYIHYSDYDLKGFTPAITAFYDFSSSGSLNFSLAFAPKGSGLKIDTADLKFNLSYLELPMAYQFQVGNDHFKFFLETGFYLSYLLSAKFIIDKPDGIEERKITSELHHLDFGMLLGAGPKYYFKNGNLFANIRYEFGFTSLGGYTYYNTGNYTYFNTGNINNCYSISAGYVFDLNYLKNRFKKGSKK